MIKLLIPLLLFLTSCEPFEVENGTAKVGSYVEIHGIEPEDFKAEIISSYVGRGIQLTARKCGENAHLTTYGKVSPGVRAVEVFGSPSISHERVDEKITRFQLSAGERARVLFGYCMHINRIEGPESVTCSVHAPSHGGTNLHIWSEARNTSESLALFNCFARELSKLEFHYKS